MIHIAVLICKKNVGGESVTAALPYHFRLITFPTIFSCRNSLWALIWRCKSALAPSCNWWRSCRSCEARASKESARRWPCSSTESSTPSLWRRRKRYELRRNILKPFQSSVLLCVWKELFESIPLWDDFIKMEVNEAVLTRKCRESSKTMPNHLRHVPDGRTDWHNFL